MTHVAPIVPDQVLPGQGSGLARHIKSLDGLRGIAVLMVFCFHFIAYRPTQDTLGKLLNGARGLGWSGVDLFFVLSGFLITGILFDAKGSPNYFRNFYARRTLRIFPLYYGMVFLCTIVFPQLGVFKEAVPSGGSWSWWLYLSNVRYTILQQTPTGWLGIFWSLSVEEHFYLLWPAIIFLCGRRSAILVSAGCMILASLSRACFIVAGNKVAPYLFTPCRMDALASGAFVALCARGPGGIDALVPRAKMLWSLITPLAVAVAFWRHSFVYDPVMQLAGLPLIACSYSSLVAVAASRSCWIPLRGVLEMPALRSVGKYSYGMYVFQFAVLSVMERLRLLPCHLFPDRLVRGNDAIEVVAATTASFSLAFVSWHVYEKHFLRLKRFFEYPPRPPQSTAG